MSRSPFALIIFSLFVILCQCGCAMHTVRDKQMKPNLALPNGELKTTDPFHTLSESELGTDIDFLEFALLNAYIGSETLPRGEFNLLLQRLNELRAQKQISSVQFCVDLQKLFENVSDGHLRAALANKGCTALPLKHVSPRFSDVWTLHKREAKHGTVAILKINWFPGVDAREWRGFHQAILDAKRADHIVVDLRDNDGGDDSKGMELANELYGTPSPEPYFGIRTLNTIEAYTILLNNMLRISKEVSRRAGDVSPFATHIEVLNRKIKELQRNQGPRVVEKKFSQTSNPPGKDAYLHEVYILINRQSISSAESTATTLRSLPRAHLVGQRTAGLIHFGNVGIIQLPHSGIMISMGTHFTEGKNGEFLEKIGITPDLPVPENEDALAWLFKKGLL